MATEEPGIKPVVLYVNGEAVSTLNPLPATGGGGAVVAASSTRASGRGYLQGRGRYASATDRGSQPQQLLSTL